MQQSTNVPMYCLSGWKITLTVMANPMLEIFWLVRTSKNILARATPPASGETMHIGSPLNCKGSGGQSSHMVPRY